MIGLVRSVVGSPYLSDVTEQDGVPPHIVILGVTAVLTPSLILCLGFLLV